MAENDPPFIHPSEIGVKWPTQTLGPGIIRKPFKDPAWKANDGTTLTLDQIGIEETGDHRARNRKITALDLKDIHGDDLLSAIPPSLTGIILQGERYQLSSDGDCADNLPLPPGKSSKVTALDQEDTYGDDLRSVIPPAATGTTLYEGEYQSLPDHLCPDSHPSPTHAFGMRNKRLPFMPKVTVEEAPAEGNPVEWAPTPSLDDIDILQRELDDAEEIPYLLSGCVGELVEIDYDIRDANGSIIPRRAADDIDGPGLGPDIETKSWIRAPPRDKGTEWVKIMYGVRCSGKIWEHLSRRQLTMYTDWMHDIVARQKEFDTQWVFDDEPSKISVTEQNAIKIKPVDARCTEGWIFHHYEDQGKLMVARSGLIQPKRKYPISVDIRRDILQSWVKVMNTIPGARFLPFSATS